MTDTPNASEPSPVAKQAEDESLQADSGQDIQAIVFRTLIDIMPDRIYAKDTQSRFILANKAVAILMGKDTPEEMLGKTDFDFYPEKQASEFFAVEQELIHSGQPLIACEQLVPNLQTGEPGWLQTTKVHLRDSQGKVIGLLGIARDITERKRFEGEIQSRNQELSELNAKLSQAQELLMQSEKLASIGQLAAGVAHEINNPMGFVLSNVNSLESYMKKAFEVLAAYSEAKQFINSPDMVARLDQLSKQADLDFLIEDSQNLIAETKEGITRVRRIVQDLKDFSRVDVLSEWEWSNLHQGIDSTLNILASEIKNKADVVKAYGNIADVECISSQINQVVMNLLLNAVDAIGPERGMITVRTGTDGPHVWFEISDTGGGIPEKLRPRIFDPFFTTKPVGKGTGLGLSLSYGIIQRHHGCINVESELGKGSTFKVHLPIKHSEA